MKTHQKVAAVLVSSLGLSAWGCSGDAVESGVDKAGSGVKSVGKGIENVGDKLKEKAHDMGEGFDKGLQKAKDLEEKGVQKLKDAGKAVAEGAKNAKDKIVEEGKDLKDKAAKAARQGQEDKDMPDKKD